MQLAIVCDLNRCVGCLACSVACKMENNIPIGSFYNRILRIGPNPKKAGNQFPDVEMYFLPMMCQHCEDPKCISVCPTQASYRAENGTILIDKEKCIGCQLCLEACPYNVRYYNEETNVVEKCTLCNHLISKGQDPICVTQCAGKARIFGDLDDPNSEASKLIAKNKKNVHSLPDQGNHPSFKYILRDAEWRA